MVVHSDSLQLHFLPLFKSLHVNIPGYAAKLLGIHHHTIMTHTSSGRCVCGGGGGVYVHCFLFKLSGGLQSTTTLLHTPSSRYMYQKCPKNI